MPLLSSLFPSVDKVVRVGVQRTSRRPRYHLEPWWTATPCQLATAGYCAARPGQIGLLISKDPCVSRRFTWRWDQCACWQGAACMFWALLPSQWRGWLQGLPLSYCIRHTIAQPPNSSTSSIFKTHCVQRLHSLIQSSWHTTRAQCICSEAENSGIVKRLWLISSWSVRQVFIYQKKY